MLGKPKRETVPVGYPANLQMGWYRQMCMFRAFEREIVNLNKQGLLPGTAHLYIGMDAIAVGACSAMKEHDFLTSTHRGHGHGIARGLDIGRMMAEILGRVDGYYRGRGGSTHIADISKGLLGADGIVGGGIPIAVGAALGARLKGNNSAVFCFFGDGASNQGSFHESLNLAAVQRLPVVFICENNLLALSAPFAEMTAGASVAKRAEAYAMPGETVNGNDVEAVYRAAARAAAHARAGSGPSLLECVSYRWEPHSIFTRTELRTSEEMAELKKKDPLALCRARLLESKAASNQALDEIDSEVAAAVVDGCFFDLDAPIVCVCNEDVPMPVASSLQKRVMVSEEAVIKACHEVRAA